MRAEPFCQAAASHSSISASQLHSPIHIPNPQEHPHRDSCLWAKHAASTAAGKEKPQTPNCWAMKSWDKHLIAGKSRSALLQMSWVTLGCPGPAFAVPRGDGQCCQQGKNKQNKNCSHLLTPAPQEGDAASSRLALSCLQSWSFKSLSQRTGLHGELAQCVLKELCLHSSSHQGMRAAELKASSNQASFPSPSSSQGCRAGSPCHDSAGDMGGTLGKAAQGAEGQKHCEEPQCSHCCPGYWDWRPPTPAHSCCLCLGSLPSRREQEMRVQAQDSAHMKEKRKNNCTGVQG